MKVSFFPRGRLIHARINSGKRGISARVSTGIKLIGNFDSQKERFTDRTEYAIRSNAKITEIRNRFDSLIKQGLSHQDIAAELMSDGKEAGEPDRLMLSDYAEKKAIELARGEKSASRKLYSDASVAVYISAASKYRKFVSDTGMDIDLFDCDLYSKKTREERQRAADNISEVIHAMVDWMVEQGHKPNTQKHYINFLNLFLSFAEKDHMIKLHRENPPPGEEFPIVTLDESFVSKFISDVDGVYDTLPDKFKWMYEVSVIILLTTFRIKDAIALKWTDIIYSGESGYGIRHVSSKRKKSVVVPIPASFYNRLKANQEQFGSIYHEPKGTRATSWNYQFSAASFFSLFKELNVDCSVQRIKPDQQGTETVTKPLYKFITAHALRRTAITLMLHAGVPELQVKFASGHSLNSTSFKKYINYVDSVFNTEITSYQERLLKG